MAEQAIVIDPRDSVAIAVVDLSAGQLCTVRVGEEARSVELKDRIPFGHKFALRQIRRGESVLKYGEVIGEATSDIEPGNWVHVHNVVSKRGSGQVGQEAVA
jgi:altronate dehydratase small subunit